MTVAVDAIQFGRCMRERATTGHWDREVEGNARISTLLPICNVFEEVFGLGLEARSTETEGMVLGIGVTITGEDGVDERHTSVALYRKQFDQMRSRSSLNSFLDLYCLCFTFFSIDWKSIGFSTTGAAVVGGYADNVKGTDTNRHNSPVHPPAIQA